MKVLHLNTNLSICILYLFIVDNNTDTIFCTSCHSFNNMSNSSLEFEYEVALLKLATKSSYQKN